MSKSKTLDRPKRLLTVGHSYVLRSNRRLAEAIQTASHGRWEVTVAAPEYYKGNPKFGDLKPERLLIEDDELIKSFGVRMAFTDRVHFAMYGLRMKRLLSSGFDAIHCWEEPFVLSTSQVALWTPAETILTFVTFQNLSKKYPPPFNGLERYVLARANGWVAGANLVEKTLERRPGYSSRPHAIIGLGVDTKRFKPDIEARQRVHASLHWTNGIPVVGFLGRFTEAKGLPLLLRVLDRTKIRWNALFVGSGALENELRLWAQRYGDRVQIISGVGHERVSDYLNSMDILVAPSQTTDVWREQFGRMLIEAFACKLAVIASDSGEIPFVVGDAGRVVGEKDEIAYQQALEELLADNAGRLLLASKGYDRVLRDFTWEALGEKYIRFYDSLVKAKTLSQAC